MATWQEVEDGEAGQPWRQMSIRFREPYDYGKGPMIETESFRVKVIAGWVVLDYQVGNAEGKHIAYIPSDLVQWVHEIGG